MYRCTDLMFTFLFQYLILGIGTNIFKVTGAFFITLGMVMVMSYKVIDTREQEKLVKCKDTGDISVEYGCIKRLFFSKF